MSDLVNISLPDALYTALLGYGVVFLGLVLLMAVVTVMGRIMARKPVPAAPAESAAAETPAAPAEKAPGAAGELKLYDLGMIYKIDVQNDYSVELEIIPRS